MYENMIWNFCIMMNVISDLAVGDVREAARSLRRSGIVVPAMNHNVVVLNYEHPNIDGGFSILPESVEWIRDSLAQSASKTVNWAEAIRIKCACGSWYPKNAGYYDRCRECFAALGWGDNEAALRPRETSKYEEGARILGIRLVPFSRDTTGYLKSKWNDRRFNLMVARRRIGYHANNDGAWYYSGLRAADVAFALEMLGKHDEAAEYRAMPANKQVHREVVFFHYVHTSNPTQVRLGFVDVALADDLIASGKAMSEPTGYIG